MIVISTDIILVCDMICIVWLLILYDISNYDIVYNVCDIVLDIIYYIVC